MWLRKIFKRIKVRWILWTKKTSLMKTYEEEVVSYERTCFKICLKLISNPNSEFMIAPMSQKRYIKNDIFQIFVMMDSHRVEITNHVFNYNVKLSERDWQRLTYIFDTETEKRRMESENEVNSRITHSLDIVLERISNFK
jgi:hypothetical protein